MSFNVWTFLLETINFLVLAFVLHRLLYRPLRAAVDRRRAEHEATQAAAEAARHEAEELNHRAVAELADVEQRRVELLEQVRSEVEARRTHLLAEAEQAAQRRLTEARQAVEQERREMLDALQDDVVQVARSLAERLLRESVDASLHDQLVKRLIETLEKSAPCEPKPGNAVDGWSDGSVLETACELAPATRLQLESAIKSLSGAAAPIDYRVSPELLGGVRLRLGGTVWDASLAGQLEQISLR